VGVIVGTVLGVKASKNKNTGIVLDTLFNSKARDSAFYKSLRILLHML
jgi:hypothetical protein